MLTAVFILHTLTGFGRTSPQTTRAGSQPAVTERDGQHNFDFEIGTWKSHLSRLLHLLKGPYR